MNEHASDETGSGERYRVVYGPVYDDDSVGDTETAIARNELEIGGLIGSAADRWIGDLHGDDPPATCVLLEVSVTKEPATVCGGCGRETDPTDERCPTCGFPDGAAMIEAGYKLAR